MQLPGRGEHVLIVVMRLPRVIFTIALLVATSWSLAAAYPAAMPAAPGDAAAAKDPHACCRHKTAPAKSNEPKKSDSPAKCLMMQCCRMLPTRADDRPVLQLSGDAIVAVQVLPPVRLLSLAEPADIFHPPRA